MTAHDYRIDARRAGVGVVGDHARIEGGIHFHGDVDRAAILEHEPPTLPDPGVIPPPETPPPGSRVPYTRNELFTGRADLLRSLARDFLYTDQPPTSPTRVIHGIGGVGKTQLAVEFAYRYGRFFYGVHWLDASQPEAIAAEIADCGREMCLPGWPAEQSDQVARTLREWELDKERLVVLDYLDSFTAARRWLARLSSVSSRVLVTSRRSDWPGDLGVKATPLDVLEPQACRAFLRQHLTEDRATDEELDSLAHRLGHLPLALEMARRYLNHLSRLTISDFLDQMDDVAAHPAMRSWRADRGSPTGHDLDLGSTFELSWRQVDDDVARRLVLMSGYCAPGNVIPVEVFERASDCPIHACYDALDLLTGLGLLQTTNHDTGHAIHRLLAEFARHREDAPDVLDPLCGALAKLAQDANSTGIPARFAPLYPHARSVASASEESEVKHAVALWDNVGYYLGMIANYEEAEEACSRALALAEQVYGTDHPETATCVATLGWILQSRGDLHGALACFQRALSIDMAALESPHVHIVRDLRNIGDIHKAQGDLEEAQRYIEQALQVSHNLPRSEGANSVAHSANSLGWLLKDRNKLLEAQVCFEEALEEAEDLMGPSHPDVATCAVNLGLIVKERGRPGRALRFFDRALEIDQAVFGPMHPTVARDLSNQGWAHKDMGDLETAQQCFERAREVMETCYGPEQVEVTGSLVDLGWVSKDLGDLDQALSHFRRALTIDETTYGSDHVSVAHDLHRVGMLLHEQGNLDEVKETFERALAILHDDAPGEHWLIRDLEDRLSLIESRQQGDG